MKYIFSNYALLSDGQQYKQIQNAGIDDIHPEIDVELTYRETNYNYNYKTDNIPDRGQTIV